MYYPARNIRNIAKAKKKKKKVIISNLAKWTGRRTAKYDWTYDIGLLLMKWLGERIVDNFCE